MVYNHNPNEIRPSQWRFWVRVNMYFSLFDRSCGVGDDSELLACSHNAVMSGKCTDRCSATSPFEQQEHFKETSQLNGWMGFCLLVEGELVWSYQ